MRNVYAYTATVSAALYYPAFVSLNKDDKFGYRLTVRTTNSQHSSEIVLTAEQLKDMAHAINQEMKP